MIDSQVIAPDGRLLTEDQTAENPAQRTHWKFSKSTCAGFDSRSQALAALSLYGSRTFRW
jgi:hypothetical protein